MCKIKWQKLVINITDLSDLTLKQKKNTVQEAKKDLSTI